MVLETKKRS